MNPERVSNKQAVSEALTEWAWKKCGAPRGGCGAGPRVAMWTDRRSCALCSSELDLCKVQKPVPESAAQVRSLTPQECVEESERLAGRFSPRARVWGYVVTGPKREVRVIRNEAGRHFYAAWCVEVSGDKVKKFPRTEKQALALARRWAVVGYPSEET